MEQAFIKQIVLKMIHTVFSPGDFAIEEGDIGSEVFFISAGNVSVIFRDQEVATLSMGDCFGEIALIMPNTRRTAAIRANNFVETQMLRRLDFEDCLAGYPQVKERMEKAAEIRIQQLAEVNVSELVDNDQAEVCTQEEEGEEDPLACGSPEDRDSGAQGEDEAVKTTKKCSLRRLSCFPSRNSQASERRRPSSKKVLPVEGSSKQMSAFAMAAAASAARADDPEGEKEDDGKCARPGPRRSVPGSERRKSGSACASVRGSCLPGDVCTEGVRSRTSLTGPESPGPAQDDSKKKSNLTRPGSLKSTSAGSLNASQISRTSSRASSQPASHVGSTRTSQRGSGSSQVGSTRSSQRGSGSSERGSASLRKSDATCEDSGRDEQYNVAKAPAPVPS